MSASRVCQRSQVNSNFAVIVQADALSFVENRITFLSTRKVF